MKILHVVIIFFTIPYFLGEQLNYFSNKGYELYVICSPSELIQSYSSSHSFKYKQVPILRKISLYRDLKALISIVAFIKKNKIDIVVGHTPKGALLAMISAFISRVPTRIYFRHGLVYETSRGLTRFILMSMDRLTSFLSTKIVCVSPSVYQQSLSDNLNSEKKQTILHKGTCNGIDVKRFHRVDISDVYYRKLRNKYNILDESIVIGYTGRLVCDKGIVELVEAFITLREKHSDLLLLLVGMLEEKDALPMETVDEIEKNPSIIYTGYVSNDIIENYYALMDIFVLPSYREGFPTSILEASSMELPILTTRATGCRDAIVAGETGEYVEHDSNDIVKHLELFIKDRDLKQSYGANGRKFVVDNFRQERVWEEIEKLYQ